MSSKRDERKKLNASLFAGNKNKSIYINNCYTRYTRALFMAAKKFKVENNYKYLWYKNSQFLLRKVDNGAVTVIRSFDDIAQIQN